jgi:heme-degrading monooxygenase HmoA
MKRVIARPPESVTELCLIRLDIQARGFSALRHVWSLGKEITKANAEAIRSGEGLLHSEFYRRSLGHYGLFQYWRSFEAMEAWTHRPPHSEWWRVAVERMRRRGDFGISHETYLVPRDRIEAIALNCAPAGLFAFCETAEPVGEDTNSRGRLRLRESL